MNTVATASGVIPASLTSPHDDPRFKGMKSPQLQKPPCAFAALAQMGQTAVIPVGGHQQKG